MRQCVLKKDSELHLAVAHHIRIGRHSLSVAFEQISHDPLPVIAHEIDHFKADAEFVRDPTCIFDILHPRAMTGDILLVDPVFHVGPGHLMPLFGQQGRRHTAVHAAREADQNFCHIKT